MKNNRALMYLTTFTMLFACQKENSLLPTSTADPDAERYANLHRPTSVTTDGNRFTFSYEADGRLISRVSETETFYVKRDQMNRVAEIDITQRTPYVFRGSLEMESKQRIIYGYLGENKYPFKAAVMKSVPGNDEYAIQNISFEFDKRGAKLRETAQDLVNNLDTKTDYIYDELGRMTMMTISTGKEILKSEKVIQFVKGFGVYTIVPELSFLPGETVQKGLPDMIQTSDQISTVTTYYNYEQNAHLQPITINSRDSNGIVSNSSINY